MRVLSSITLALCVFCTLVRAQETSKDKPSIVILVGAYPFSNSYLTRGYAIGGGFEKGISSSFTLGMMAATHRFDEKLSANAYNPLTFRASVKYRPYKMFPKSLFELSRSVYVKAELGVTWEKRYKFESGTIYILGIGRSFQLGGNSSFNADIGLNSFFLPFNDKTVSFDSSVINLTYNLHF